MEKKRCSYGGTCIDPMEVGCNLGFPLSACEHWQKAAMTDGDGEQGAQPAAGQTEAELALRLPWTGNSLGARDFQLVTSCAPATIIGVVGAYNSGKTTLLTLIYTLLQQGARLDSGIFAGSWTLTGWENLAA